MTGMKLARLRDHPQQCRTVLRLAGIAFTPLKDADAPPGCSRRNLVALDKSASPYNAPVRVNCALAAALAIWERDVVLPAARTHLNSEIARIEHLGAYACRNVRGSNSRISQHASANAIDISAFRLKDGRRVSVAADWQGDTPEARFLQAVRTGSCGIFRAVLSSDYNRLHKDHFHLDLGPYRICR